MIEHLLNSVPASFKLKKHKAASSVVSVCVLVGRYYTDFVLHLLLATLHIVLVSLFADLLFSANNC